MYAVLQLRAPQHGLGGLHPRAALGHGRAGLCWTTALRSCIRPAILAAAISPYSPPRLMRPAIESIPASPDHRSGIAHDLPPASAGWRLEDFDFGGIDKTLANQEDEPLLLMLVASSFVEAGTHLYASNLIAHFEDDSEVATWLAEIWEREELQHGRALRTYVANAWPAFDWERAYAGFMKDYRPLCTMGKLESRRGLEMAARCVVETGTTALYRGIHERLHEPVLSMLVRRISEDEVGHYKRFFRYFRKYQQEEHSGRAAVLGALIRRSIEIVSEDTGCALRHAYVERYCQDMASRPTFEEVRIAVNARLRNSVPLGLAAAMWLRPLQLNCRIERQIRRVFPLIARLVV